MSRKGPEEPGGPQRPVFRYDGSALRPVRRACVAEHPLDLVVNGRPLATLIASPHDLPFLVAGFLRMQGLVAAREDIESLGVCPDLGTATVRIRGAVPETVRPVITSGCGGGIALRLPGAPPDAEGRPAGPGAPARCGIFTPGEIAGTMEELGRRAERYREAGGIHSAAAGDGRSLLVVAEDIGRHNAVDRVAGEALLKGIDLSGTILATSGRVSSEMAAKAAALGVALIASRTSPTDLAVRICEERGIALAGYVRGDRFTVYAHPWRIVPAADGRIAGVSGVILAGGGSRRMGRNKALLPYGEGTLIEAVYRRLTPLFGEVLVATNEPELFPFLPCRKVPDLVPGGGSLAGIQAGLHHASEEHVFVAACDMPHLGEPLVRGLCALKDGHDAVLPESDSGIEPLCAVYGKGALGAIGEALSAGRRKIVEVLASLKVRAVPRDEVARLDPAFRSFRNVNTPDEYGALLAEGAAASREDEVGAGGEAPPDAAGPAREGR